MSFIQKSLPYFSIGWALIIMVLSVVPNDDLPSLSFWEPDKVMHFAFYGVLTTLVIYTIKSRFSRFTLRKSIFSGAGLCIFYGLLIEFIQLPLPTRQFDMLDGLANSIGCLLASAAVLLISGSRKQASR